MSSAGADEEALGQAALWLRLQIEAGADCPLGEAPIDRFAASAAPEPAAPGPAAPGPVSLAPVKPQTSVPAAPSNLAGCATLAELSAALAGFEGCSLREGATQMVFADGNPQAALMLVGEAPGREEDRIGRPFVGESGRLLDRMLAAIGLDRTQVYIINIVPWRPPGNRAPSQEETVACLPFARRHIELVAPRLLVPLGGVAAQALFGASEGITRLRGRWFTYEGAGQGGSQGTGLAIPAMALFHPAYLLRQPALKRETWMDLLKIKEKLAVLA